jgi:hypothetical protein
MRNGTARMSTHPDSAPLEAVAPMKGCRRRVVQRSRFALVLKRPQPFKHVASAASFSRRLLATAAFGVFSTRGSGRSRER